MEISVLKKINRVIVHGNCPDGMASGILLYDALGIEPEFHLHGTDRYQNLEVTNNTLFCDISPPEYLADAFIKAGGLVLDHHKQVKTLVSKFGNKGIFADEKTDPGVSGAVLAYREVWKEIRKNTLAENFANLAGIRDTWQKQNNLWELACHQAAALTFYPWEFWKEQIDSQNNKRSKKYSYAFKEEMIVGKMIYQNRMLRARKCADDAVIGMFGKLKVAVFNDPDKLTSDAAEMLKMDNEVNIIAGFYYSKSSTENPYPVLCFSIRSDNTFDVGEFASIFGGGGHSQSAGYTRKVCMDDDPFSLFLDDLEVWKTKIKKKKTKK